MKPYEKHIAIALGFSLLGAVLMNVANSAPKNVSPKFIGYSTTHPAGNYSTNNNDPRAVPARRPRENMSRPVDCGQVRMSPKPVGPKLSFDVTARLPRNPNLPRRAEIGVFDVDLTTGKSRLDHQSLEVGHPAKRRSRHPC